MAHDPSNLFCTNDEKQHLCSKLKVICSPCRTANYVFFLVRLKFQSRLSGIVCTAKYLNIAESLQVTDRVPNRNPCLRTAIMENK